MASFIILPLPFPFPFLFCFFFLVFFMFWVCISIHQNSIDSLCARQINSDYYKLMSCKHAIYNFIFSMYS